MESADLIITSLDESAPLTLARVGYVRSVQERTRTRNRRMSAKGHELPRAMQHDHKQKARLAAVSQKSDLMFDQTAASEFELFLEPR